MNQHLQKTNRKFWFIGITFAIIVLVPILMSLSSGYGKVSRRAYQFATATYSATLAKSPQRLDRVDEMLQAENSEEIKPHEVRWIQDIIRTARRGAWESASNKARRMLEDQVQR